MAIPLRPLGAWHLALLAITLGGCSAGEVEDEPAQGTVSNAGADAKTGQSEISIDDVGDNAAIAAVLRRAFDEYDERWLALTGVRPGHLPLRVHKGFAIPSFKAAQSRPGIIEVRPMPIVDDRAALTLRHEAAHQLLWAACPAASGDALFHEAFALAFSGERELWIDDEEHLSLPRALQDLNAALAPGGGGVDTRAARRAIARLVAEQPGAVPPALVNKVRRCADHATWSPLLPNALARHSLGDVDVLLVLDRHSGDVVFSRGDVDLPLPFGSTLKPFLVGGAAHTPKLAPQRLDPTWACGTGLPARMDAPDALLRSCNGWFLDWHRLDESAHTFGSLAPALEAVGLAPPRDMAEAIGVRGSLSLSPRAMAQAWRLLAAVRPEVLAILEANAVRGTLQGFAALRGVAAKTGTVRDERSAPVLAWLVAVNERVVVVRSKSGATPQSLVPDVVRALHDANATPARARADVQVWGLLSAEQVRVRCDGAGVAVRAGHIAAAPKALVSLAEVLPGDDSRGRLVCTGPLWLELDSAPARPYRGVVIVDPAPKPSSSDPLATPRQLRARRGSDYVLQTSLVRYASDVVAAEDAAATGSARQALLRIAAHNAHHAQSRHGGRPLCDTTHCQTFRGDIAPIEKDGKKDGDRDADMDGQKDGDLLAPVAGQTGWLTFSQGGTQSWSEVRAAALVHAAVGQGRPLSIKGDRIVVLKADSQGAEVFDEVESVSCEIVRSRLHLPSCPTHMQEAGLSWRFSGTGQGHGLGFDVEAAKAQPQRSADELLRAAYGPPDPR